MALDKQKDHKDTAEISRIPCNHFPLFLAFYGSMVHFFFLQLVNHYCLMSFCSKILSRIPQYI